MKTIASEKGQITIPKAIRESLGIRPGTVLEVESEGGKLAATKRQNLDQFAKWRGAGVLPVGKTVDEYLKRIRG